MEQDLRHRMMTEDEFLEHYGVKGMHWGVLRDQASGGSKKAAKKLAKADVKWEKELHSTTGFIKINNRMADYMNGPNGEIAKHNNDPRWRGKTIGEDPVLQKKYMDAFSKVSEKVFVKALHDEYGESPSGKFTTSIDYATGDITVTPNQVKHGIDGDSLVFHVEFDKKGHISKFGRPSKKNGTTMNDKMIHHMMTEDEFLEHINATDDMTEDEFIEHFGVKGMHWGQRKSEPHSISPRKAARKAANAERDNQIEAARARFKSGENRQNYKTAKATYKANKAAAKKAFNAVKAKNLADYNTAQEAKSGRETVAAIITSVAGLALSTASVAVALR